MPEESVLLEGTVLRRSSNLAWVDTPRGVLECTLRGRLRGAGPCVAGDRVRVLSSGGGRGAVEEVLPRRTVLSRGVVDGDPAGRVIAANIDQVAVVISAANPGPRWALVDRLLVESERHGLRGLVVVNKVDLLPRSSSEEKDLEDSIRIYRSAGVDVLTSSAVTGAGVGDLAGKLRSLVTVLSGHSGVGKTALANALVPGLGLRTNEVNPVTGKGRHTSSMVILVGLPSGGYLMDTPGFREYSLEGVPPAELGRHYEEFRAAVAACRYKDCLHRSEPGCAVREAVEEGSISKLRYQNYLQILETLVESEDRKSQRRRASRASPGPS